MEIGKQDTDRYPDTILTRRAIESLQKLSKGDQPFFLAVGYRRPHLPFNAAGKFWDLYDRTTIKPSPITDWPKDSPAIARTSWGELRVYHGMPRSGPVTREQAIDLIHGYARASVTSTTVLARS